MLPTSFLILAVSATTFSGLAPTVGTGSPAPVHGQLPAERSSHARTQTLLARAGFSPGLIDGKPGRKSKLALEHFQRAHDLEVTGTLDAPTRGALEAEDALAKEERWTRSITLTQHDLEQVTGPIPEDWNERAALSYSGYANLEELLAERGWCSTEMVQLLNPGVALNTLGAGDTVNLPDVPTKPLPHVTHLAISLSEQLVSGFNADEHEVFMTHCSIARVPEKRPVGTFRVQVVVIDPDYTFDPKDWPEVTTVSTRLRIAPGPRTPVGAAWIGLDKPGIGMHGTVRPQDIGKTGSHGCFRLVNWEAQRLARAVKIGTAVEISE